MLGTIASPKYRVSHTFFDAGVEIIWPQKKVMSPEEVSAKYAQAVADGYVSVDQSSIPNEQYMLQAVALDEADIIRMKDG